MKLTKEDIEKLENKINDFIYSKSKTLNIINDNRLYLKNKIKTINKMEKLAIESGFGEELFTTEPVSKFRKYLEDLNKSLEIFINAIEGNKDANP